jgi:5-hydroxyisourate hydrolase
MSTEKDPITCHALNTITGLPAANLICTLINLFPTPSSPPARYTAVTNDDGRVMTWTNPSTSSSSPSLSEFLEKNFKEGEKSIWCVRFDVGPWFEEQGIESFWPEVEVKFTVKRGERHVHVPVLVGPWSYTTYRGS